MKLMGDNTHQAVLRLTLLHLSKASTDCITFYRILLCNLYFMQWLCIYVYEFYENLVALGKPLQVYLVYPHDENRMIEWLCLVM
jgi:hypothetical protein